MVLNGGDPRLHSVMGKVMNIGSFPLALLAFTAGLHACVQTVQGGPTRFVLLMASASLLVALAANPLAALFVIMALVAAFSLYGIGESRPLTRFGIFLRGTVSRLGAGFIVVWLLLSICFTLALTHYIVEFSSSRTVAIGVLSQANLPVAFAALILLCPFSLLHAAFALKKKRRADLFILISIVLGILLTVSLNLPDRNQYKGVYFVAILMAISSLLGLSALRETGLLGRVAARAAIGILLALTLVKVIIVTRYYEDRAPGLWWLSNEGPHVAYSMGGDQRGQAEALYWLRDKSESNAIAILPPDIHNYDHLTHERMTYVRRSQALHTDGILAYDRRIEHVKRLYHGEFDVEADDSLLQQMAAELPGRPLYAVIQDEEVSADVMKLRGAIQVFQSPDGGAHVYWLNPTNDE